MRDGARRAREDEGPVAAGGASPAPGKRTEVERRYGARLVDAGEGGASEVHGLGMDAATVAVAARGGDVLAGDALARRDALADHDALAVDPARGDEAGVLRDAPGGDTLAEGADRKVPPIAVREAGHAVRAALRAELVRGADAVEMTRIAHEVAAHEILRLAPQASPQERADAAMALATATLTGDYTRHLPRIDSGATGVGGYLGEVKASGQGQPDVYGAGTSAAAGLGGTLDPRFDDGSTSQAGHIGFFVAAGYMADGSVVGAAKVMAAAVYHESVDPETFGKDYRGASRADYVSSAFAAHAGARLKRLRDRGDGDLIGTVVAGFMAKQGTPEPCPPGRSPERHAIALAEVQALHDHRSSLLQRVIVDHNPASNALIGIGHLVDAVWGRSAKPGTRDEK